VKFKLLELRPLRVGTVVIATLLVAGWAMRPLENPAWQAVRAGQPAMKLDSLQGALGQGVTVGLLGGFRAIVADFFWMKTNSVWSDNDLPATQTLIKLVTAIDPRPLYFWQNGARMIAYDMPNWRIVEAGGYDVVSKAAQQQIDREQSAVALKYLNEAFGYHPDSVLIYVEMANVYLNRLKDVASAAEIYHKAALRSDAPYYVARIYGELLRRLGRNDEAYAWLKQLYPTLPKDAKNSVSGTQSTAKPQPTAAEIEMAMAPVVLERIREIEKELKIPQDQRFSP
jgi:tetratricopeptide (TPR) repeat protein